MARKALCIGINDYPMPDANLRGCVNDANAWADLLAAHYDFAPTDIRTLTDQQATKRAMLDALKDLLKGARRGDTLVFTNSSHGTYIVDPAGDDERYDQAVCPYDSDANLIVDDELRELFGTVPAGVHLVAMIDNCHSGTGTRRETGPGAREETCRVRFLDPALRGAPRLKHPQHAIPNQAGKYPEANMRDVLLSGCTAVESSYDDRIEGVFHGAMTWYALKAIREANYVLTWAELHQRLTDLLRDTPYQQHPQLEGTARNKDRQVFA